MKSLCLISAVMVFSGNAQTPPGTHQAHQTVNVLIDGAQTPELVSDQTAIKMFLMSITEPPNPTPQQLARLGAKISRIGLNPSDRASLLAAVEQFDPQFHLLKSQSDQIGTRITLGAATRQQFVDTQVQIDQLTMSTHQRLLARLSPDGAAKLANHLKYIKTRIKVMPSPKM